MAERVCGSSPPAFMRLKVSRQEIPASTRMVVEALRTIALFPRLPEASTETETPMAFEHTRSRSGNGSTFLDVRYLRAHVPKKISARCRQCNRFRPASCPELRHLPPLPWCAPAAHFQIVLDTLRSSRHSP